MTYRYPPVGPRVIAAAVTVALLAGLAPAAVSAAVPAGAVLPLGDTDLAEHRSSQTLAGGVTLTRIVRGTGPAPADQIGTTTRGP
jgi:hypothetical protein